MIHMSYVVESMNDKKSHYYQVDEYYNVTYNRSSETVKLLAFDPVSGKLFLTVVTLARTKTASAWA